MKILLISLLMLIAISKAYGQEKIELKDFRHGKLANGFCYFIKHLEEPQEETSLRFYIKAGANQEETDQLQVAHFIEHLAFKPTENFPKGIKSEVLKFRMSSRDVGGTTGYKYTRYLFDVPPHNKQALKIGLKWFKDIATVLKLTNKNINQERGSIRQEFLYGNRDGLENYYAEKKLEAKLFPCRLSYGTFLNHIQTISNENLKRFYKDWYRPDLMAIMIVGNIKDMAAIEQLIKSFFNDIPKPGYLRKKTKCDSLYFERPPQFVVEELEKNITPKILEEVEYRLIFRQPKLAKNIGTKIGYKQYIAFQLFLGIMEERFHQKQTTNDASFQVLVGNSYKYGAFPFSYAITFKSEEQFSKKSFQYVFTSLHQFREYGILEEEWSQVKEKYLATKTKADAHYWHQQLLDYFVKDEALFKNKQEVLNQWVQELSIDEFNALVKQFFSLIPEDIGIIAPTGSMALQYTKKQIRGWIQEAYELPTTPYHLPEITSKLLTLQELHKLKKKNYTIRVLKNGMQEIILDNGVKVILKPYEPPKGIGHDHIRLHGFSKTTGAICFPKKDYYSALNAPSIVEYTGLGKFDAAQIKSFMETSNIISCKPYIDYKESGIQAVVGLENTEEMLQLVYLYYTQPKYDAQRFKNWKVIKQKAYIIKKDINEDFKNMRRYFFNDRVQPPVLGSRYLKSSEAYNSIQKTSGKRSYEIYRKIFGSPKKFTFIITGDFKTGHLLPLIQKYLGNLLQNSDTACKNNNKTSLPIKKGPVYKQFIAKNHQMENVKYNLSYITKNKRRNHWKKTLKVRVLGELVDLMLRRIRYQKGFAVYNFGAIGSYNYDQACHKINFDIACKIGELRGIQLECQRIIEEIKNGKIKKEHFQQAIKKIQRRYSKQTLLQHRNIQKMIYEHFRYEEPWIELKEYNNFLKSLDVQDMIETAHKCFKKNSQYEFVLRDEIQ